MLCFVLFFWNKTLLYILSGWHETHYLVSVCLRFACMTLHQLCPPWMNSWESDNWHLRLLSLTEVLQCEPPCGLQITHESDVSGFIICLTCTLPTLQSSVDIPWQITPLFFYCLLVVNNFIPLRLILRKEYTE